MNIYKIKEQYGITFCLSVHRSSPMFSPMELDLFSSHLSPLCFVVVVVVVSCLEIRNHVSFFVAWARQHFLKFILISMFNNPALLGSWQRALQCLEAGNRFHTKVQTNKFLPVYLFPKASLQRHELTQGLISAITGVLSLLIGGEVSTSCALSTSVCSLSPVPSPLQRAHHRGPTPIPLVSVPPTHQGQDPPSSGQLDLPSTPSWTFRTQSSSPSIHLFGMFLSFLQICCLAPSL